ncbi:MAG: hypothetical protein KDA90_02635 [Planctomycetaceae bacterium]|nr:hypothetical protein [Planctomycetaceae bacterium]
MNKPEMINITLPRDVANVRFTGGTATVTNHERQRPLNESDPELVARRQVEQQARQAELLEEVRDALLELERRRQNSLSELQELAVELAATAAAELTCQLVDREQYAIDELVRRILDQLSLNSPTVLSVHPQDVPKLKALLDERSAERGDALIDIKADTNVAPGNCRLAADNGRLAISDLARRLGEIRQGWLEELKHAQTERRQTQGQDQGLQRFPDRRDTA